MFVAVVNRYFERLKLEYRKLDEALVLSDSDECFFIGVVDSSTLTGYVPRFTAIGYSTELAVEELEAATGLKIGKVEKF